MKKAGNPGALALLILLLVPPLLSGQILPEEEAPATLFETELGDADVDLLVDGYWDASVKSSIGIAFLPGYGVTYPYVFPGFTDGVVFEQKPDLLISLWLKERYYFETAIGEDYEMNSYLLGYQGKEGEFVQSVKAGNADIEISPYPYMDFPGSARRSPGLSAMFQTARSRHEFLLRYDPSLPQKKTFIGRNEVRELRIDPPAHVKGRYFVLPDTGPDFLELLIEDKDGAVVDEDGRRYRRATNFDYAYSPADGTVTLAKSSPGRVLAYYEKGGLAVGSPGLGPGALPAYAAGPPVEIDAAGIPVDFSWGMPDYMGRNVEDWLKVSAAGREALLLYDPGAYNPFEIHGVYPLSGFPAAAGTVPRIVRRGTDAAYATAEPLSLAFSADGAGVRVLGRDDPDRSMTSRYPFADDEPRLYGPDRLTDGGGADFQILVQTYTPVLGFTLTNDIIPGSVSVLRNGRREDVFSVDYATGILSLPFEPASSDRIEVFFRTYSGEGEGGDILFGSGSTIELRKDLLLKVATGLRWNVLKGSYSTEPGDHTGYLGASAGLSYTGENVRAAADGALMYMNPDTSGLLRLLGMEKHEMELEMSKYNMFPSSVPAVGAAYADGMTAANRGRLLFKNYESVDLLGSVTLNSYASAPTDSFAYATGSFPGPYVASAASEGADKVMVLDFAMDAGQEWVGAQLNLASGWAGALDLSKITSVRFAYKVVELDGEVALRLHAGALDEDLDGDGRLDEETGASSRGYEFNDGGLVLFVGAGQKGFGNEFRDSEDANRNAVLERENPGLVFAADAASSLTAPGTWQAGLVAIPAAERNRLAAARSLRIVVRKAGAGARTGRILIGKIVFEGAAAASRADEGGSLSLREVPESLPDVVDPADGRSLTRAYKSTLDTFHSGDGTQHVLEAAWQDLPAGASWEIRSFTTGVPAGDYRKFNLFLRIAGLTPGASPGPGPSNLILAYTDAEGKGLRLTFPAAADNVWKKLSVDIPGRRASLGAAALPAPQVDAGHGELNRFSLRLENVDDTAESGVLYLDEVHLSDPRDGLGFAGSAELAFSVPGTALSVGGVPVVSNLAVTEKLNARTALFPAQKDADTEPGLLVSATTVSADILEFLAAEGEFAFSRLEDRTEFEGGHAVRFPAGGGPLVLSERYKRDYNTPDPAMSRANRIDAAPLAGLSLGAGAESVLSAGNLTQTWEGSADYAKREAFSLKMLGSLENTADGFALEDDSYGESWLSSYELLLPWTEGSGTRRRGRYRLDAAARGETAGISTGAELSFDNSAALDGRQRNGAALSVEVPLRFRRGPYDPGRRLSLLYSRSSTALRPAPAGGDFGSDIRSFGTALADHHHLWASVPFVEIFSPRRRSSFAEDTFRDVQGEYTAKAGLRFSRPFGSRITDLLVPAQADAEAGKTLTRGGEVLGASNTWSLSLTNFAINLFGRQGAFPRFAWYESDEFQLRNGVTLLTREGETDRELTVTAHQVVTILGRLNSRFILDHNLTVEDKESFTYRGTGSAKYVWRSPMLRDFGVPLMRAAKEDGAYYLHTEKVDLTYSRVEGLKSYLVLGHETALTLSRNGFIKAEINLGVGFEKDYSGLPPGYRVLLGLGGGISAHLMF